MTTPAIFEDGVKGAELEETLKPQDVAEIMADHILKTKEARHSYAPVTTGGMK